MQAASQQDLEHHINELARVEAARLTMAEALRGSVGSRLSIVMRTGTAFHGRLCRVETEWVLLDEGSRSVLLPLAMIQRVQGLGTQRARAPSKIPYTFAAALRVLSRNRSALVLELDSIRPAALRGVIDEVGSDYIQLMQLSDGVNRDRENRQGSVVVPTGGLVSLASSPDNEF
ncbi:hypothetical protein [Arthrobacter sp. H35-D1]|uniref:hypothetical protein n=1 Tax=Arthrobacter sp. H35-D1 TaxID=3046202 RepID=UPI0024B91D8D|nr:hypothetical protein [Arthrobacter sp. H35-D1]MDJ0312953.1 hypothetical protein [Arthrobacter sp. H35-D1]